MKLPILPGDERESQLDSVNASFSAQTPLSSLYVPTGLLTLAIFGAVETGIASTANIVHILSFHFLKGTLK